MTEGRGNLVKILMAHSIYPKIINFIARTYVNDATNLFLNNQKQSTISITNTIKQGCNDSALLFLLLTYESIERLQMANVGFRNQLFKIPILYYADDGLMLTHPIKEAKKVSGLYTALHKFMG